MELKLSSVAKLILWMEPQDKDEYTPELIESVCDAFEVDNCTAAQILDEVQTYSLARWVEVPTGFVLYPSAVLVSAYAHQFPAEVAALHLRYSLEPYQMSITGRLLADVSLNDACALMSMATKEIPNE